MLPNRGRNVVRINNPMIGTNCCCCFQCCSCLCFLRTEAGILKLAEAILGSFCQSLALNYGFQYSGTLGLSYYGFISTASWAVMTVLLLLFCYVVSEKSYCLIRQSLFEVIFNVLAAMNYISSSAFLGIIVGTVLYPLYLVTPFFQVYPAMTGTYILGTIVGAVHGYDAYKAYKYYRGYF